MDDATDGEPVDRRQTYDKGSLSAALLSPDSLAVLSSYSGSLGTVTIMFLLYN